jgi:hypothetical protein
MSRSDLKASQLVQRTCKSLKAHLSIVSAAVVCR